MVSTQAPLSLDEEARLYTTNVERERYGLLATLFGIIVSLDYLERAYVRDSVPAAEWVAFILSDCELQGTECDYKEVFTSMYSAAVTVQNYAQACG